MRIMKRLGWAFSEWLEGLCLWLGTLRWSGLICLGVLRNARLRQYARLCLGVLVDVLVGREVHFEMHLKRPGPDVPSFGPERWRPETRNHVAFETSRIREITFTTFVPVEKPEITAPGRITS